MASIKLTYFNLRARGEITRLLLAHAGVEYEDERISPPWENSENWMALKPHTPWGTLPILEYDGVRIGQSVAIARFLANKFGLAGKSNLEKAQADEIVDVIQDLINAWGKVYFSKDELGLKKFSEVTVPTALDRLEKVLQTRGGKYMVGGALTWADIMVFNFVQDLYGKENCRQEGIKTLCDTVGALPNIKAWVEKRPITNL